MRQEFTKKTKRLTWALAQGHCQRCDAPLSGKPFEYDHIVTCANGGDNSPDNCELLCWLCHQDKTGKVDAKREAKIRRVRDRVRGIPERRSRRIAYRLFDGTPVKGG
jgi:5-methylcytosine-specific restriction endonuclease McrA